MSGTGIETEAISFDAEAHPPIARITTQSSGFYNIHIIPPSLALFYIHDIILACLSKDLLKYRLSFQTIFLLGQVRLPITQGEVSMQY